MLQKTHVAALGELESEHAPSHSVFGFWLYLMTDCVLFASLFAVYAVMANQFAGGPTGKDLFDIQGIAVETAVLLLSSITYGFAMLAAHKRKSGAVLAWLAITFVLGLAFLRNARVRAPDRPRRGARP
jgi:cytochrome o ubiquinol oxidase subunit 3